MEGFSNLHKCTLKKFGKILAFLAIFRQKLLLFIKILGEKTKNWKYFIIYKFVALDLNIVL